MKKLFIILICLDSFFVSGQDSSKLKVSVTLQARDLEYIGQIIFNRAEYEEMYDNMKAKFRVASPPNGTTNVTVDTVELWLWADLYNNLRGDSYARPTFNRFATAVGALGQSWLTARVDEIEAYFTDRQNSLQKFGRQKLRKSNN